MADDREAMQGGGSDQRQVRDGRIRLGMRLISATISENGDARNEEKVDKRQPLPNLVTITLPECTFQPRKADMNKDYDMLGASVEQVRQAFARPVHVLRDGSG